MNTRRCASPRKWDVFFSKAQLYVLEIFPNLISKWIERILSEKFVEESTLNAPLIWQKI